MNKYLSTAPLLLGLAVALPSIAIPASPAVAQIGIGISVHIAPPALPVYVQPPLPAPGYLWTPGYWAYGDDGYYWVPGTWVEPPSVGLLWTPPYWGFEGGVYGFHAGYWGPHVGFYGGINYGFGYNGAGFFGGEWRGGGFAYNGAYNNFGGTHVTNVYNQTVNNTTVNRTSFNGPGGVEARPTPEQEAAAHEQHIQPTSAQVQHFDAAKSNPQLRFAANHGAPAIAATPRPGAFSGPGVTHAGAAGAEREAAARGPAGAANRPGEAARQGEARAANPQAQHAAAAAQHAAPRPQARPAAQHQAARPAAPPAPRPAARPAPRPAAHPAPRPAARPAGKEEHK